MSTWEYGAVGGPLVATTEEEGTRVSRRAQYDTLGRLRVNEDLCFGRWRYEYNTIGELTSTVSPTGNVAQYDYDQAGRLLRERYDGVVDAEKDKVSDPKTRYLSAMYFESSRAIGS